MFGPLVEVEMSKKCPPLWREAHLQVNMHKRHHSRTIFGSWDVEKVHAVVARSPFRSQKCKKLRGTEHFWTFRCRFASQSQGIVYLVKSEENLRGLCSSFNYNHHYTTLHYTTTTATTTTTLRYYITLLHYTTLITLHYNTLHSTTLRSTPLHYTTLRPISPHYTKYNYNHTTLH